MMTGRENSALLPLISDPTFSPTLAHEISRSGTSGGVPLKVNGCFLLLRLGMTGLVPRSFNHRRNSALS